MTHAWHVYLTVFAHLLLIFHFWLVPGSATSRQSSQPRRTHHPGRQTRGRKKVQNIKQKSSNTLSSKTGAQVASGMFDYEFHPVAVREEIKKPQFLWSWFPPFSHDTAVLWKSLSFWSLSPVTWANVKSLHSVQLFIFSDAFYMKGYERDMMNIPSSVFQSFDRVTTDTAKGYWVAVEGWDDTASA